MSHLRRVVSQDPPAPEFTITDEEIADLGYVVVTLAPYNAQGDGVTDDTAAIQAAIDAAYAAARPVWFPSGTYLVSNTIRCYMWAARTSGNAQTNNHQLFGATPRPVIKVKDNATAFNGSPRPVVGFAKWRPTGSGVTNQSPPTTVSESPTLITHIPASPYISPSSDWQQAVSVLMKCGFYNIDIDTNGKAGADGLFFATAQGCYLGNVRVQATGSNVGIQGLPGRSAIAMNLEVEGGAVGVDASWPLGGGGALAGSCVAGLRCFNQTTANIQASDFVPLTIVGFHFTRTSGSAWTVSNSSQTAANGATLIDGMIETASGIAIDNSNSQPLYLRNVYITGTGNLVKSGSSSTVTGTGTWKRIDEYSANANSSATKITAGTAATGATALAHYYYLDGVEQARAQEQVSTTTDDAGTPPTDLVDKHIVEFPLPDQDDFINITDAPYNADPTGTTNSRTAILNAVAAAATAGHNRVFVPYGTFAVGTASVAGTTNISANTKFFGCGMGMSDIRPHSDWVPIDGSSPYIITTTNTSTGTTQMAFLTIHMPGTTGDMGRYSHVQWRAGRRSATFAVDYDHANVGGGASSENHSWGRQVFTITANGGGRHYGHWSDGDGNNGANFRAVLIDATTQPFALYGFNCEAAASFGSSTLPQTAYPEIYMEANNASNIRVYSCKREGQSPTITLTNCTNVGVFSGGGMRDGEIGTSTTSSWTTNYHEILGSCEGIVMANLVIQNFSNGTATSTDFTLYEAESSSGILWPNGVCLYKRGYASYSDSAMSFD